MTSTNPNGPDPRRRRRSRRGRPPAANAVPAKVVAEALKAPQQTAWVEEPLTALEVTKLKGHFRFLRENRQLLKLRVNAAEDLLLNGVKEPTHRGICQHLLAKVERSRVLAVSQTLPPEQAVRLLSGIIRFAPDIAYVLRYLECVRTTSSQQQAGAALTEALKQIDFAELSAAQMRQLVSLIVEVFAERDLPVFLFTLLYDKSFREALDRSLEGFPDVLGRMVRPLRILHQMIAHTAPNRIDFRNDVQALKAGVTLLLDVSPSSLAQLPEAARQRLFQVGCDLLRARQALRGEVLRDLHASLSFAQDGDRAAASVALVEALVAAGEEPAARKWIDRELSGAGSNTALERLRESLERPRVGMVAMEGAKGDGRLPPPGRWHRGWHLLRRENVLVRLCRREEQAILNEQILLWRSVVAHGISSVIEARADIPVGYIAVELPGAPLHREVKRSQRVDESARRRWAVELCAVLESLSLAGLVMLDGNLNRFNVDQAGHLWLVDLWPLKRGAADQAHDDNLRHAQDACEQLLSQAFFFTLPEDVPRQAKAPKSLGALAALFV